MHAIRERHWISFAVNFSSSMVSLISSLFGAGGGVGVFAASVPRVVVCWYRRALGAAVLDQGWSLIFGISVV
jgi:hypothetical protein